jgi:hypothetical protein
MTHEEELRRVLAQVNALNAQADKIQDPAERRHFLSEGMQRIYTDLDPILRRYLAETKRQEPQSMASDTNAIDSLILLAKQALKAARHVLQALTDKATKLKR